MSSLWKLQLLGWVATSFLLATAVVMIPVGRIADIYGRKRVFTLGLSIFIISTILCAVSQSDIFLISFRVIQGIGAAMIWGPAVAILTSYFSAAERGRALGVNTAAVYAGLSIGPFWGGFLTENFGWRSVFYVTAALVVVAAVLVFWKMEGDWSESRGEKVDFRGSFTLMASLILILYGFTTLPGLVSIPCIILGLIGMVLFYRIEVNMVNPVMNVQLFKHNRIFVFALIGILAMYCASFAPNFLLSLYLQYNLSFSPQTAGAILVIQPVIMAVLAPISGRISDRFEPLVISAVAMAICCVALVMFAFLNEASSLLYIFACLAVLGFGFGLFATPAVNAVMSSVDKKYFGVAAGTQATMRHTGQVLSMGIVMILFAIFIGDVQITPPYYGAFLQSAKTAFLIFAAICFAGIFILLAGGKLRKSS